MDQKPLRSAAKHFAGPVVSATRTSRKLLIKRLREIDRLNAQELAVIMADAEKIKQAFHIKR